MVWTFGQKKQQLFVWVPSAHSKAVAVDVIHPISFGQIENWVT
jgi:hypothetical protein